MGQREPQYQSYLLRLWRTGEGKACRVMLQHVDSHERHGFADLEDLCAFLRERANDSVEEECGKSARLGGKK